MTGTSLGYPELFEPNSSWSQFISQNVKGLVDNCGRCDHLQAVIDGERAFWRDPFSDWVLILYD